MAPARADLYIVGRSHKLQCNFKETSLKRTQSRYEISNLFPCPSKSVLGKLANRIFELTIFGKERADARDPFFWVKNTTETVQLFSEQHATATTTTAAAFSFPFFEIKKVTKSFHVFCFPGCRFHFS